MIDLEKMKNDLRELAQIAHRGDLTRPELRLLKIELLWAQVQVEESLVRHRHPEETLTPSSPYSWRYADEER